MSVLNIIAKRSLIEKDKMKQEIRRDKKKKKEEV